MSGGSLGYFYSKLEEYDNVLKDRELNDLVHDLVKVFHDREWADDADISEGEYNETVAKFKDKWFTEQGKTERYTAYIDETIKKLKKDLGIRNIYCKYCKHWSYSDGYVHYGKCEYHTTYLKHAYDIACDLYDKREDGKDGRRKADTADNA